MIRSDYKTFDYIAYNSEDAYNYDNENYYFDEYYGDDHYEKDDRNSINVEITKKSDPDIQFEGTMIWKKNGSFGFEFYSEEMETIVECELNIDDWKIVYSSF